MASAVREAIRTPARMESENVRDQHLEAGGRIVSPAFWRLHHAKVAQVPPDWSAGFNTALRGDAYIHPTERLTNRFNPACWPRPLWLFPIGSTHDL